ncbi:MAG TPA: T9SS type A sorting domain-containing protein [Flavobacterium sp.]|jgi:hypothetical protein
MDTNGCGSLVIDNIEITTPNAPVGSTEQTFFEGQTLADLVVSGENIQWYSSSGTDGRALETALPATTLLVNGTTYYASQTINGAESIYRLPVTVIFSLQVAESVFSNVRIHPNPVKDNLHILNAQNIDGLKIFNLFGQVVYQTVIGNPSHQVDLSRLHTGLYFITLTIGNKEKTLRIIKQ